MPTIPWTEISKLLVFRSAKQCRERWDNHEKFDVENRKRAPITHAEGDWIMQQVAIHGTKWAHIGRLCGRPENGVKNWYYQEAKKRESREARLREKKEQEEKKAREDKVELMRLRHAARRDQIQSSSARSSLSSMHTLPLPPVRTASHHQTTPLYPSVTESFSHHDAFGRQSQTGVYAPLMHSRRQSNVSNPPSLASDHDSVADSPRSILEPVLSSSVHLPLPSPMGGKYSPSAESWVMHRHERSTSTSSQHWHSNIEPQPISPAYGQEHGHSTYASQHPSFSLPSLTTSTWASHERPSPEHNSADVHREFRDWSWNQPCSHASQVPAQTHHGLASQSLAIRPAQPIEKPQNPKLSLNHILNS